MPPRAYAGERGTNANDAGSLKTHPWAGRKYGSAMDREHRVSHRGVQVRQRAEKERSVKGLTLCVVGPGDLTIDRSAIAAGPHREGEEP